MMQRTRGLTIVEMLIVGMLLGLLLAVLVNTVVPTMRIRASSEASAIAQRAALAAIHATVANHEQSHPESVVVHQNPPGLSFLVARNRAGAVELDEGGDVLWQARIVLYRDEATSTLRLQRLPLVPPEARPDPLKLDSFSPSPEDHVVTRHVAEISWSVDLETGLLNTSVTGQFDRKRHEVQTASRSVLQEAP